MILHSYVLSVCAGFMWGGRVAYVVTRKCSPKVDILVGEAGLR